MIVNWIKSGLMSWLRKNSAGSEFIEPRVNLIEGTNISITMTDDPDNGEVDVQIAATGEAGGIEEAPEDGGLYGRKDGGWERITLLPPIEEWYDPTDGLPEDPEVGDRYGSDGTGSGWTDGYIYEWDGTEWVETAPEEGWLVWELFALILWVFFSGGWMEVGVTDHRDLDTLGWTSAGHTGTASTIAGFDGDGAAESRTVGIANDNIVEIDDADAASGDIAYFTASGLAGYNEAEFKTAYNMEAGTDYLAQQTIGIEDNNLLEVDDAGAADDEWCRFTANGIEGIANQTALSTLLGATLVENDAIKLDSSMSADGKYNGITVAGTAGATLAFGDLVYLAVADSRWELADADAEATTKPLLGICVLAAAADGSATNILLVGMVRADTAFPAITVGAPVFVDVTSGDISHTAPSGSGDCIRVVGQGYDANTIWFCPSGDWYELA